MVSGFIGCCFCDAPAELLPPENLVEEVEDIRAALLILLQLDNKALLVRLSILTWLQYLVVTQ